MYCVVFQAAARGITAGRWDHRLRGECLLPLEEVTMFPGSWHSSQHGLWRWILKSGTRRSGGSQGQVAVSEGGHQRAPCPAAKLCQSSCTKIEWVPGSKEHGHLWEAEMGFLRKTNQIAAKAKESQRTPAPLSPWHSLTKALIPFWPLRIFMLFLASSPNRDDDACLPMCAPVTSHRA